MNTVVLNAMPEEHAVTGALKHVLKSKNVPFSLFNLKDMTLLPCRSCGSCGLKTPGRCVLGDDLEPIMRKLAGCKKIIFISQIRFGGYSSTLKKLVDRLMVMGLPLYMVKDGHLLHPMRYDADYLIGIGVATDSQGNQKDSFSGLVESNGLNFSTAYKSLIYNQSQACDSLQASMDIELAEVYGK